MDLEHETKMYDTSIRPIVDQILTDLDVLDKLMDNTTSHMLDTDLISRAETDMKDWLDKTDRNPIFHKCEHCNVVFKRKESYRRHISTSRSCAAIRVAKGIPVWLDLHRCGVCGETFTRESSLLSHMVVYHTAV